VKITGFPFDSSGRPPGRRKIAPEEHSVISVDYTNIGVDYASKRRSGILVAIPPDQRQLLKPLKLSKKPETRRNEPC